MSNKGYGFIYREFLPQSGFTEETINISDISWAVTGTYNDIADNHCACVCAVNCLKLLQKRVPGSAAAGSANEDERSCFIAAHRIVGNGPVLMLGRRLNKIFRRFGLLLRCRRAAGYEGVLSELKADRPVPLLLTCALFDWHWVLCIGIRRYEDGTEYLNIIDNWNNRADRYLPLKKKHTWVRALRFKDIERN